MVGQKKEIVIDFADCSGGCNSIEHATRFNKNQVSDESQGFVLRKSGLTKYPGCTGLSSSTTFADHLRGLFTHRQLSGTENLYAVSGGTLSLVTVSDGSLTSKYSMGGAGNFVSQADSYGKKFVCNGAATVKIEGTTAYQVGITAPTGASAAAAAGAGLPDGVYGIYVSYARKVSGSNVLYSVGQSLGNVTLGAGNNQISITLANSSDTQVNNKVVWIKSPSEAIHYFFHETGDNTTTAITITATTLKNTSLVYEYDAADNGKPPAITYIYAFADRLWGIVDNVIWFSEDGSFSVYDLEIWRASNFRNTPYKLTGIFSVGQNLYFNCENGILLLPNGDINEKLYLIETRWHFKYMRTVAAWNNGVVGVTNDGVRMFDGQAFTSYDLGYPIREKIVDIYNSAADFQPCGYVYRRSFRDEYHLMWQDTEISATVNNKHAVLNLSSMIWADSNNYQLAWEFQPISGNFAAVTYSNIVYIGQTHASASKVYKEEGSTTQSIYVYTGAGTLLTSSTDYSTSLRTREFMFDLSALLWIKKFYLFVQNDYPFTVQIYSGNDINKFTEQYTVPSSGGEGTRFDSAIFDTAVFPSENAVTTKKKLPTDFKCRSFYIVIRQNANDINFKLMQLNVTATAELSNYL